MTLKCPVCHEKFTPADPLRNPDFPGYCDQCLYLEELTRPSDPVESKICDLKIGGSLFFPVTPQDPRPWETLRAEIKRPRWAYLDGALCVHPAQEGDAYIATRDGRDVISFETQDGARLFKSLTFDDLSLGVEYVNKITT